MLLFVNTDVTSGAGGEPAGTPAPPLSVGVATAGDEQPAERANDQWIGRPAADRSGRLFAWWVGVGLALLVAWLVVVLALAGVNVRAAF